MLPGFLLCIYSDRFENQNQTLNGANNSASTFTSDLFEDKKTTYGSVDYKYNNDVEHKNDIKAGDDAAEISWFDLDKLPALAFDHEEIIGEFKKIILKD